jgi:hypothetical protein
MRRPRSRRSARGARSRRVASPRRASRACPGPRRRRTWSRRRASRVAPRASSPPSPPRPQPPSQARLQHWSSMSGCLRWYNRRRPTPRPPICNALSWLGGTRPSWLRERSRRKSRGTSQTQTATGSDRPPPKADLKRRNARSASPDSRRDAPSRPPTVGRVRSPVAQSAPLRRSPRSARNRLDRSPVQARPSVA